MKHSLKFWLFFITAILLAIYFATRITMIFLGSNIYKINQIKLSSVNGNLNNESIINALNISPNTKSLNITLSDALTKIQTLPDIESVAIRRLGNGNLEIHIKTRHGVAIWNDGKKFYPLTANGELINRPTVERPNDSVMFIGALPKNISKIVSAMHNAQKITNKTDYMEWIENRRWNIKTIHHTTILLPETDPDMAIKKLNDLETNNQILIRKISTIDMRDSNRILIK